MSESRGLWDRFLVFLARRRSEGAERREPSPQEGIDRAGARMLDLVSRVVLAAVMLALGAGLGLPGRRHGILDLLRGHRKPAFSVQHPNVVVSLDTEAGSFIEWADSLVRFLPVVGVRDTGSSPPNRVAVLAVVDTSAKTLAAEIGPELVAGLPELTGFWAADEEALWEVSDTVSVPADLAMARDLFLHLCCACDDAAGRSFYYYERVYRINLLEGGLSAVPEEMVYYVGRYTGDVVRLERPK